MRLFLLGIILLPFLAKSQAFEKEDFIFLVRKEHIKIELKNNNLLITKDVHENGKYQSANKLYFANEFIHFDSFSAIDKVEAYTILPDSGKKVNVDHFETKHQFDNGIFFSDQQSMNFVFPAVTEGAVTSLSYQEVIKEPQFMGAFRFGSYVPTLEAVLTVEFPKNVALGYKTFNLEGHDIEFNKKETEDSYIYTWKGKNIQDFRAQEESLSPIYYIPHIILHIEEYETKTGRNTVLKNVNDLYRWYTSLIDRITTEELTTVHSLAESITEGIADPRNKARAIFNWVQENITYIAFEDGLGGFIPRNAETVCTKRYGDCKDMANLLYEMLNHVGIEAYHAWIGTRDRPYSYFEVPTPIVDNHMITAAVFEKDTIYLDATDSYVPFGMPSSFTQGKEALIGIDASSFKVQKVPVQKPEQSITLVKTHLSVDENVLKATEKRLFTGYEKVSFIYDYTFKKEGKTDEEYLNTSLQLGNNKTAYRNIEMSDPEKREDTLQLSYELEVNNYIKKAAGKVFINMHLDRTLSNADIETETQRYAKKIEHAFLKEYQTILEIPEGYKVTSLPAPLKYEDPRFGFDIDFSQEGNTVLMQKRIYINTLTIPKTEFDDWNLFIKSLIKAYKKSITLENL
ncbi:DUF3857 domain-containing protein [Ascidiimonas aurantiaca]|uniref:DUF3857 domain-containing protein n=1 Tax=Ascidiimonas aurantiaca TaxID=1685432 RepID=UPI0030EF204B